VVDTLEVLTGGNFRVHVTVRNTGERDLAYQAGIAYALEPAQSERFLASLEAAQAAGQVGSLVREVTPHWFPMSRVPAEDPLPAVLRAGQEWTGWLRFVARPPAPPPPPGPPGAQATRQPGSPPPSSAQGLPGETVGLVIILLPSQGSAHPAWTSSHSGQPYIAVPR
jgi:hypothetical protein